MPYKSQAQQGLFHAKMERGEMDPAVVAKWDKESKGHKNLPYHVKKKKEHEKTAGFLANFCKIASVTGWDELSSLLSEMRQPSYLSVGDRVAYYDTIKWVNEPDGKHAKGLYADFEHEGLPIGSKGSVVAIVDPYAKKDDGQDV